MSNKRSSQMLTRAREKMRACTDVDLAYLAGLIDGEGSITVGIRSANPRMRERNRQLCFSLSIQLTSPHLIQWVQTMTGVGRVYHHPAKNPKHKDAYQWVCAINESVAVLEVIRPYLKLKAEQCVLFLEIAALRRDSNSIHPNQPEVQMRLAQKVQHLNKRGA